MKEQFIKKLRGSLKSLPESEVEDIISDYEEHFRAGKESGRSENEIAKSLGEPSSIARQLRADHHIRKADDKISASSIVRAVLATAGLSFFNLVFIAFPFFGLLFILCGLIASGVAAFASGVVGFLIAAAAIIIPNFANPLINIGITPLALLFLFIALTGFSILFLIGCWFLAKWFYQLTVSYLRINMSIIKGDKEMK
ncbi:MAG: DUF1700 domain-containing protein [Patescibacteria group bacterium]